MQVVVDMPSPSKPQLVNRKEAPKDQLKLPNLVVNGKKKASAMNVPKSPKSLKRPGHKNQPGARYEGPKKLERSQSVESQSPETLSLHDKQRSTHFAGVRSSPRVHEEKVRKGTKSVQFSGLGSAKQREQ